LKELRAPEIVISGALRAEGTLGLTQDSDRASVAGVRAACGGVPAREDSAAS
jgi:hypothetical protein